MLNRSQPNKTEVVWCTTGRRQHHLLTCPLLNDDCEHYEAHGQALEQECCYHRVFVMVAMGLAISCVVHVIMTCHVPAVLIDNDMLHNRQLT